MTQVENTELLKSTPIAKEKNDCRPEKILWFLTSSYSTQTTAAEVVEGVLYSERLQYDPFEYASISNISCDEVTLLSLSAFNVFNIFNL